MQDGEALPHDVVHARAHAQVCGGLRGAADVGQAGAQLVGGGHELAVRLAEGLVRPHRLGDVEADDPPQAVAAVGEVAREQPGLAVGQVYQQAVLSFGERLGDAQ